MENCTPNDAQLTILLTLKGRHLFTLRWLWHANRIKFPFPVFIADGEVHSSIVRLIEDRSVFPNLLIEYHRYNDVTFYDFYQKIDDALSRIRTPYVMMSDNDDFLFPSGIIRSLNVLERSLDYVCVGGGVAHFETQVQENECPSLSGKIVNLWYQQRKAYQSYDLDSSLASERVFGVYTDSLTVWYNVYRTNALRCMASELMKYNFEKLENGELFQKLRSATLGKLKADSTHISYFRQYGTSSNSSRMNDFLHVLVNERHVEEIQIILKLIAAITAKSDGISQDVIREQLGRISTEHLRLKMMQTFGWRASLKAWIKKCQSECFLRILRLWGDRVRSGKTSGMGGRPISRQRLFKLEAKAGATEVLINEQKKELAEIEATLQSRAFFAFIQLYAPELQSSHQSQRHEIDNGS